MLDCYTYVHKVDIIYFLTAIDCFKFFKAIIHMVKKLQESFSQKETVFCKYPVAFLSVF